MTLALRFILLVGIGLALWLSLMSAPPAIPGLPTDPMKHAVGWAGLTLLSGMAHRKLPALELVILMAFGNLATEVLQGIVQTGRNTDAIDWVWGMAGTLAVASLRYIVPLVRPCEIEANPCDTRIDAQMTNVAMATALDEATPRTPAHRA